MRRSTFAAALLLASSACGGSSSQPSSTGVGNCPRDLPQQCQAPTPSWTHDVAPIIAQRCLGCHGPSGSAGLELSTYQAVYSQREEVLSQINSCLMPPAGATPLDAAQRKDLLDWLVCEAPQD